MLDFENLDYYELLGVSRSTSPAEIKRAYRREISKYHPDRFNNATREEQEYARRRSQYLTEAYSVLSNFATRNAYNQSQLIGRATFGQGQSPPAPARDHQAELYEQAQQHLANGRLLQAIGALRQLQQINPFYRDSADLLSKTEEEVRLRHRSVGRRGIGRPVILASSLLGSVAVVALVIWMLGSEYVIGALGAPVQTNSPTAAAPTAASTLTPVAVAALPPKATATPPPAPTQTPLATAEPTTPPSPSQTPLPPTETPAPTLAPAVAPQEQLLVRDTFESRGWANMRGSTWSVGYQRSRYRITAGVEVGPIWSYRVAPAVYTSVGVDLQAVKGEGGLLLRFVNDNNYLILSINPRQTSYRIEQLRGGTVKVLAGGQSEAILSDGQAINRLIARWVGDRISIFVNNQLVAEVDASDIPQSLRYGLVAIGGETASDVYFDNLEMYRASP